MIKLFYATQNKGKQINMKNRLKDYQIELLFPDTNCNIKENGASEVENAVIKTKYHSNFVQFPILGVDSGMFFEDTNIISPKLFVKRNNGKELSNDELIEYYKNLASLHNGKIKAYFKTGLALIIDGHLYTTEIVENHFI